MKGKVIPLILIALYLLIVKDVHAQQDTLLYKERIAVIGKPAADSITLRWAPLDLRVWQLGNTHGYTVERYVMARDGKVLNAPEKAILTGSPVKPFDENEWEPLVKNNRYAAIAAQALFGDRFEVDLGKSDVFTIVNKVRENEQRFSFALFSADMHPAVAKASGLWFTDKKVKKGEKYLYRVVIDPGTDSLRGSLFIGPDDRYGLPKPQNLKVEFKDQLVSLRWDKDLSGKYTAYIVERSADGKLFTAISDAPLTTVSPTEAGEGRYEYAKDSIADLSVTYHYRVKGITPFGEQSGASDVATGKGQPSVTSVPYILQGENLNNATIRLTWEFPESQNSLIRGFSIERSSKPSGDYTAINQQFVLSSATRMFEDLKPQQVNYYRVTALGKNGEQFRSPIHLAQLIDSIPPSSPIDLKATIDEYGKVSLSWKPNEENDIYGYRIYRSNNAREEMMQITSAPVKASSITDQVSVNTLNDSIYYSVMAIDRNQNHSQLSKLLMVALPDKVRPQPPVFLPVIGNEKGVQLAWIKSSSTDVVRYEVYRMAHGRKEWQRINVVQKSTADSIYQIVDEYAEPGRINSYTIVAIDDAGLESDPASPVSSGKIDNTLRPGVAWKAPLIVREQNRVVLTWEYNLQEVEKYWIYKDNGDGQSRLYKTIKGTDREHTDFLQPGKKSKYRIMAIFRNGSKSVLSNELEVQF